MIRRFGRLALAILILALMVEVIIILPANLDLGGDVGSSGHAVDAEDGNKVEQAITGVHSVGVKNETKDWELWAERAVDLKSKESWELEKVKATFFTSDGGFFNVTGNSGAVDLDSKNMQVDGEVVIKSSNGYVIKTESVSYDSVKRLLNSPSEVRMTGPKDRKGQALALRGINLEADLNSSIMEVKKDVSGSKVLSDGKRLKINSESAKLSGKSNLANFLGGVVMDVGAMRITGKRARFKYEPKRDMVTSVKVDGGVRVSDVDKWATSRELDVRFDEDKFVFRGNPRVVQNSDELFGEEIIFSKGGKKVEVKKARAKVDKDMLGSGN